MLTPTCLRMISLLMDPILQGYLVLITDSGLFIKNDSMNTGHKKGMIK